MWGTRGNQWYFRVLGGTGGHYGVLKGTEGTAAYFQVLGVILGMWRY